MSQTATFGSKAGSRTRGTATNDLLAWVLVALAAISPIPLGSNGPVAWAVSAACVAAFGLIYALSQVLGREQLRVSAKALVPETALWALLLLYILFQTLPASLWGGTPHLVDVDGNIYPLAQISAAPGMALLSAMTLAGYGLFLFLFLQVTANRQRALFLAEALFAIFVIHAMWGLGSLVFWGDTLIGFDKWAYQGVATGTFVNRNSYATFLAIGVVLGVGLTLRVATRRLSENGQRLPRQDERLARIGLFIVGTTLILAALLATQSRMGLAAAGIGTLMLFIISTLKQGRGRFRLALVALLAAIVVAAIALMMFGAGTLERLGSVENAGDIRMQLYQQVLEMIGQHWATGTGAGSFEVVYPLFHRWPVSPDLIWDKAHNTYLTLWSELGLIAGSIPLLIFALLAWRLGRIIVSRSEDWWLSAIALSAMCVVAIHSLVDFSMEIQGVVYVFLAVLALGLDFRAKRRPAP